MPIKFTLVHLEGRGYIPIFSKFSNPAIMSAKVRRNSRVTKKYTDKTKIALPGLWSGDFVLKIYCETSRFGNKYQTYADSAYPASQQHCRRHRHLRESEEFLTKILHGGSEVIYRIVHNQKTVVDIRHLSYRYRLILDIVLLVMKNMVTRKLIRCLKQNIKICVHI